MQLELFSLRAMPYCKMRMGFPSLAPVQQILQASCPVRLLFMEYPVDRIYSSYT